MTNFYERHIHYMSSPPQLLYRSLDQSVNKQELWTKMHLWP